MKKVVIQNINNPKSKRTLNLNDLHCIQSMQPITTMKSNGILYLYYDNDFDIKQFGTDPDSYMIISECENTIL